MLNYSALVKCITFLSVKNGIVDKFLLTLRDIYDVYLSEKFKLLNRILPFYVYS